MKSPTDPGTTPEPATAASVMAITASGDKQWCNKEGQLHREDGPAVECANGTKEWWRNGQLHREDGPAVEYADGGKEWWRNSQRHRDDGPAAQYANGSKMWFRHGQALTDEEIATLQELIARR